MRRIFRKFLKFALPFLAGAILGYVWSVSISPNGGLAATFVGGATSDTYALFRLAGLTAFVLVGLQVITGPFMQFLTNLYGARFRNFHMYSGLFTFLFALLHPSLLLVYLFLSDVNYFEFVGQFGPFIYPHTYAIGVGVYFGQAALLLMVVTVSTAAMANLFRRPRFASSWRWIHLANYAIFFLVFTHSLKIGTDVSPPDSPLRPLWWIFFASAVVGLVYRRIYMLLKSTGFLFSNPIGLENKRAANQKPLAEDKNQG